MGVTGPLAVDDDALATCVACGLCLPHCPTFRVTGDEAASPRGRIAAMGLVQWLGAPLDADFERVMDSCVQCRGCEPVCPSAVPFGALMEGARTTMAAETRYQPWWRRLGYRALGHHRLLLFASSLLAVAQRLRLVAHLGAPTAGADRPAHPGTTRAGGRSDARERYELRLGPGFGELAPDSIAMTAESGARSEAVGRARSMGMPGLRNLPLLPMLAVHRRPLEATGDDVWLFTGCVMDAWQRPVHAATMRVVTAAGAGVRPNGGTAGCCGALAAHAGLHDIAVAQAGQVVAALPGDHPVLVNSAGCGAMLKTYGELLGTPEAAAFAARVLDVHEWMAPRVGDLPAAAAAPAGVVAVQDPCHLRHVQKCHQAVRDVLAPYVTVVELDDEGLCCGAGGAYSATHPELSTAIRARKLEAIDRAGAPVVASANPGCALHLAAAGVTVRHPMEILDDCLSARHEE